MNKAFVPSDILGNQKGLSLLETLIAIIILAVALISISYFFSRARINIEASGWMRCGLVLAQDKMEELKDLDYFHDDLSLGIHSDRVDSTGNVPAVGEGEFYREWTVTAPPDNADGIDDDEDYKLVQLGVYDQRLNPGNETLNDYDKLVAELKSYISP